jgi:hypothetical protein
MHRQSPCQRQADKYGAASEANSSDRRSARCNTGRDGRLEYDPLNLSITRPFLLLTTHFAMSERHQYFRLICNVLRTKEQEIDDSTES